MKNFFQIAGELKVVSPRKRAQERRRSPTGEAWNQLRFVGRHEERRRALIKLVHNQMMGTDHPYAVSACQPFGSGKSEFAAHLVEVSEEDWEAVLEDLKSNRPRGWTGKKEAVRVMVGLACSLHVYVDCGQLAGEQSLESELAWAMFSTALTRIEREDRTREFKRTLDSRKLWNQLTQKAHPGAPNIRQVTAAVNGLCRTVFWHLDEIQVRYPRFSCVTDWLKLARE
jgi:hypothetical protein